MATPNDTSNFPIMLVTNEEAQKKLRMQISIATGIKNQLYSLPLLELANERRLTETRALIDKKYHEWMTTSAQLLNRIFSNNFFADRFQKAGTGVNDLDASIAELEFVLNKIQLGLVGEESSYQASPLGSKDNLFARNIFIVHGHDEAAKESVARFVEKLGLEAIILDEQPNAGRTIIEKFEAHSNVGFAIVLLTPDDVGAPKDKTTETKSRARQNVILELGYFIGKLGRGRVCALYKEGVEIPSDYQSVLYIQMDSAGAWRTLLAKEIKNAGLDVDLNKAL
jgi:hypothetical protein